MPRALFRPLLLFLNLFARHTEYLSCQRLEPSHWRFMIHLWNMFCAFLGAVAVVFRLALSLGHAPLVRCMLTACRKLTIAQI